MSTETPAQATDAEFLPKGRLDAFADGLLFFVSLLPFLTALMTTHLKNAFIRYAGRHPRLAADDLADDRLREIERHRRVLVVALGLAALIALLLPHLAVTLYLVVALTFIIAPLILARRSRRRWEAGGRA